MYAATTTYSIAHSIVLSDGAASPTLATHTTYTQHAARAQQRQHACEWGCPKVQPRLLLSFIQMFRMRFYASSGGIGNTPPHLRRDAALSCCVRTPVRSCRRTASKLSCQRHTVNKRVNRRRQERISRHLHMSEPGVSFATFANEAMCCGMLPFLRAGQHRLPTAVAFPGRLQVQGANDR